MIANTSAYGGGDVLRTVGTCEGRLREGLWVAESAV